MSTWGIKRKNLSFFVIVLAGCGIVGALGYFLVERDGPDKYGLILPRYENGKLRVSPPRNFEVEFYGPDSPVPTREQFDTIAGKAEAGDAESQLYMGVFHANGDLVAQDYARAALWYQKAAEQGNARAQRNLAVLYDCGIGVQRDYAVALEWYLRAAKQNDAAAHLGVSGYPLTYRYSIFPSWWGREDAWIIKACRILWKEYLDSNNVEFPQKVTESQYFRRLRGDPGLGEKLQFWNIYYASQQYFQSDKSIAREVMKLAINGDDEAQLKMAVLHVFKQGVRVKEKSNSAEYWLRQAIIAGNRRALFMVSIPFFLTKKYSRPLRPIFALAVADEKAGFLMFKRAAFSQEDDYFLLAYVQVLPYYMTRSAFSNFDFIYKNHNEGMKDLMTLAKNGQSDCMYYSLQWNPAAQISDFYELLVKDAERGNAAAIYHLIRYCIQRNENSGDYIETIGWLERLYTIPNPRQLKITIRYFSYLFSKTPKYMEWYVKRAEKGCSVSKILLALTGFEQGERDKAMALFLNGSLLDFPIVSYHLGQLYQHGKHSARANDEVLKRQLKMTGIGNINMESINDKGKNALSMYLRGAQRGGVMSSCDAALLLESLRDHPALYKKYPVSVPGDSIGGELMDELLYDAAMHRLISIYFACDMWNIYEAEELSGTSIDRVMGKCSYTTEILLD